MFSHFTVSRIVLKSKALEDIHLPAYKGATLRGGFGYALKQVSCALKRQDCATCMLRDRCVYLYLFETLPPSDTAMMRLYRTIPQPFIIEPPESDARLVPLGGEFEFGLTLVGRAIEYIPYLIYAFMHLGDTGLGKAKGKFCVEDICAMTSEGFASIYERESRSLKRPQPYPGRDEISARCEALKPAHQIGIQFRSPTRLKSDGRLNDKPEFHHLVRSLLRRLSALSYFHCGRKLEADFKGLIERAHRIERVASDLEWRDWERYSTRQKQKMTLGGFVGTAEFAGDFSEFLPMLVLGETLHIGKAASFGLGRYRIVSNRNDS
ncbi:MAG: CRISPR system precrRNA processing endoribonuclease RAMP protein Cas6 [Syntrophobacteraceae bacterium]